jgi:hypothetical protein
MAQHAELAGGRWLTFSLAAQLANVGSEVGRAQRWQAENPERAERAFTRALELLDLTITDPRWTGLRRRELARIRELLCDAWLGGDEFGADLASFERFFLAFAVYARKLAGSA